MVTVTDWIDLISSCSYKDKGALVRTEKLLLPCLKQTVFCNCQCAKNIRWLGCLDTYITTMVVSEGAFWINCYSSVNGYSVLLLEVPLQCKCKWHLAQKAYRHFFIFKI